MGAGFGKPDEFEQFRHAMARAPLRARQAEHDVVRDREMRKQRAFLGHVANPTLFGGQMQRVVGHAPSADVDAARVGALETAQQAQQRGLAAARGAEQREQRAGLHREMHVVQHGMAVEGLGNAGNAKCAHGREESDEEGGPACAASADLPAKANSRPEAASESAVSSAA
ncbi:hypothetical protein PT2222_190141 [Paraburkholderia tropica]